MTLSPVSGASLNGTRFPTHDSPLAEDGMEAAREKERSTLQEQGISSKWDIINDEPFLRAQILDDFLKEKKEIQRIHNSHITDPWELNAAYAKDRREFVWLLPTDVLTNIMLYAGDLAKTSRVCTRWQEAVSEQTSFFADLESIYRPLWCFSSGKTPKESVQKTYQKVSVMFKVGQSESFSASAFRNFEKNYAPLDLFWRDCCIETITNPASNRVLDRIKLQSHVTKRYSLLGLTCRASKETQCNYLTAVLHEQTRQEIGFRKRIEYQEHLSYQKILQDLHAPKEFQALQRKHAQNIQERRTLQEQGISSKWHISSDEPIVRSQLLDEFQEKRKELQRIHNARVIEQIFVEYNESLTRNTCIEDEKSAYLQLFSNWQEERTQIAQKEENRRTATACFIPFALAGIACFIQKYMARGSQHAWQPSLVTPSKPTSTASAILEPLTNPVNPISVASSDPPLFKPIDGTSLSIPTPNCTPWVMVMGAVAIAAGSVWAAYLLYSRFFCPNSRRTPS